VLIPVLLWAVVVVCAVAAVLTDTPVLLKVALVLLTAGFGTLILKRFRHQRHD
jgi:hypothetical protein